MFPSAGLGDGINRGAALGADLVQTNLAHALEDADSDTLPSWAREETTGRTWRPCIASDRGPADTL
jgi:hypothetical protein